MILFFVTIILPVAVGQHDNFIHQTYVIPTEPASELTSHCLDKSNMTQCVTLNDLIDRDLGQIQEEVIFLSGKHVVNGTNRGRKYLFAKQSKDLLLRGESNNVTIICREEFFFLFVQVACIKISNLTLQNCSMNGNVTYEKTVYCCNHTFIFVGLESEVTLNNIQLTRNSKCGIDVHLKGDVTSSCASVQITNTKLYTGVCIAHHNVYIANKSMIEITNTTFDGSCIEIKASPNSIHTELDVMIKNTSFRNYSHWSTLIFRGTSHPFTVTLHDVNVSDNRSPYMMYANQTTVHLQGNLNLFNHNRGVMYIVHSRLLFSRTKVKFVYNTVTSAQGVPVYAKNSFLVFEDSHVVFKKNHGSVCGGIVGNEKHSLCSQATQQLTLRIIKDNKVGHYH